MKLRILLFCFALLFWGGSVYAAANQADMLTPVMNKYLQELSSIEATASPDQLRYIKAEKTRIQTAITEVTAQHKLQKATEVAQQQMMLKKAHVPKTHISETFGIAGAPVFTKNNIYSFNLQEVGDKSKVVFYASGRKSTKTYGKVWLITPANERFRIHKWSPHDFKRPLSEASSYKRLSPVTTDISKYVTMPGTYKIEFGYTDGIDALGIMRVELTS